MILNGDALEILKTLETESAQCIVTSPPYFGLRDYGIDGQIGLEKTVDGYVLKLVKIFREVKRVLRTDGTLWLNLGDSYAGSGKGQTPTGENDPKKQKTRGLKLETIKHEGLPSKNLLGVPWRVAFALQADGWYLRQDIIWAKKNPMTESVKDRCTKSHEYIFLLTKAKNYFYDGKAIMEPAITHENRNKRDVWSIPNQPYREAHFAVFPEALVEPCILAGSAKGDVVLDPFAGSGTTLAMAKKLGRKYIGIELNPTYIPLIEKRLTLAQEPCFRLKQGFPENGTLAQQSSEEVSQPQNTSGSYDG